MRILFALAVVVAIILVVFEVGHLTVLSAVPETGAAPSMDVDDQRLAALVMEQLRMDGRINWELLEVKAEKGKVKLFGMVKSPEEKELATHIVQSQGGATSVDNRLLVEPSTPDTVKKPHLREDDRPRVLEGEGRIKDQQILP